MFLACALTVLIETPFMALFGRRSREELLIVVCTNVVTNLSLNLFLLLCPAFRGGWIWVLEEFVCGVEYCIYALAFGPSWRLLGLTVAANCLSFFLGRLL